jgi:hypothetical protein
LRSIAFRRPRPCTPSSGETISLRHHSSRRDFSSGESRSRPSPGDIPAARSRPFQSSDSRNASDRRRCVPGKGIEIAQSLLRVSMSD